jgi:uncharacterized protein (TIGR02284 family)
MLNNKELDQLEKLLKRVVDSRDGYADAQEKAEQQRHQDLLGPLAGQRQKFAETIKRKLEENNRDVDLDGSFLASTHRFFMNLQIKLGGDDEELFEEIVHGESELVSDYNETLETITGDDIFKGQLQQQRNEVLSNLQLFKAKAEAA